MIEPLLAELAFLGLFAGFLAERLACADRCRRGPQAASKKLKRVFAWLLYLLAVYMLYRGLA